MCASVEAQRFLKAIADGHGVVVVGNISAFDVFSNPLNITYIRGYNGAIAGHSLFDDIRGPLADGCQKENVSSTHVPNNIIMDMVIYWIEDYSVILQ